MASGVSRLLRGRLTEARDAIGTLPDWPTWRRCFSIYVLFAVCTLPLGYAVGLVRPAVASRSPSATVALLAAVAVHPAFGEELLFRVVLLPRTLTHVSSRARLAMTGGIALALYLLAHPLNAWLFRPQAWTLFTAPGYLACAALLGAACTAVYWRSGSIWPPVLLHWITAVVWILLLGGDALVGA